MCVSVYATKRVGGRGMVGASSRVGGERGIGVFARACVSMQHCVRVWLAVHRTSCKCAWFGTCSAAWPNRAARGRGRRVSDCAWVWGAGRPGAAPPATTATTRTRVVSRPTSSARSSAPADTDAAMRCAGQQWGRWRGRGPARTAIRFSLSPRSTEPARMGCRRLRAPPSQCGRVMAR